MRARLPALLRAFFTATLGIVWALGALPAAAAPPDTPVVLTPVNGSQTSNPLPAASGTAVTPGTVSVYLDGALAGVTTVDAAGNWTLTPAAPLADGAHTVSATVALGGETSSNSNTNTFIVDTLAPDTSLTSVPAALTSSSSATFSFSSNEGGVSYGCSLDGSAYAPCSTPITFGGLANGAHTLVVRATDGAGNVDATAASYAWTVDVVAPAPPVISAPAAGSSMAALVAVSGSAEAGSTVAVSIDGAPVGLVTASGLGAWSFAPPAPLAAGPHTVHATATDGAGNASAASAVVNFSIAAVAAAPAPIPSLGTWGLLGLTSLLGLWGLGALRRKG